MTASPSPVTERDAREARELVELVDGDWEHMTVEQLQLQLRGLLAGALADARWAGFVEGEQRGRLQAAAVVLNAMLDEGLVEEWLAATQR